MVTVPCFYNCLCQISGAVFPRRPNCLSMAEKIGSFFTAFTLCHQACCHGKCWITVQTDLLCNCIPQLYYAVPLFSEKKVCTKKGFFNRLWQDNNSKWISQAQNAPLILVVLVVLICTTTLNQVVERRCYGTNKQLVFRKYMIFITLIELYGYTAHSQFQRLQCIHSSGEIVCNSTKTMNGQGKVTSLYEL